jgi:tetratricopeptide (TPR) repeat protein
MQDIRGLTLTASTPRAAALYDDAVALLLEYRLTTMATVKEALAADPGFAMGHCLQGYLFMMFGTFSVLDAARGALAKAEAAAAGATERERAHIAALRAWSTGDVAAACTAWDRILFEHPRDLLALRLQHFNNFWMGRATALRNTPASLLAAWDESVPGYGNVLGMLAFGYEECGEYAAAEDAGRRGVAHNPNDLWALHAVAHVLEMQGRHDEGVAWLSRPADAWNDRNPFRGHLWWHLALQHLDAGDTATPLALYDRAIYNADSNFYLDIQNAASLLARLEFCGADVGARWTALADHAETHLDDHALAFTDLHCMMSLARTERFAAARQLIDSMTRYAEDPHAYAALAMRSAGLQLCRALLAFGEGRYAEAVALFLPLRHNNQIVGASHAQREIFALYLIVAAIRSGQRSMAQALLRERAALKPGSAITERLLALTSPHS